MRHLSHTALVFICAIIALVPLVHGLSFQLEPNRRHCFIEDLHVNSHVLITYEATPLNKIPQDLQRDIPTNNIAGTTVTIRDPFGNVLRSENIERSEGVVHFKSLSDVSGLYEICFFQSSSSWLRKAKASMMNVKIEVDDDAHEYDKIESKDRLEKLTAMLEKLRDKVRYVSDDQKYMKAREKRFRQTTDYLHSRILWVAFLQALTFTCVGVWQVYSLRTFFKKKKLV